MTESVICYKFGRGEFPNPAPNKVVIFWSVLITSLVGYAIWQFGIPALKKRRRSKNSAKKEE